MTIATPATLSTVLKGLTAGGQVQLSADLFPTINLSGLKPTSPIQIDASQATINHIQAANCSNVQFEGGQVEGATQFQAIMLDGRGGAVSNLSFHNMHLHGAQAANIGMLYAHGIKVSDCLFSGSQGDGINIGTCTNVDIIGNRFQDFVVTKLHPDCVQIFNGATLKDPATGALSVDMTPITGIRIIGNQGHGAMQGYDNFGCTAPLEVHCENNSLVTTAFWGGGFSGVTADSTLKNNSGLWLPRTPSNAGAIMWHMSLGAAAHDPDLPPPNVSGNLSLAAA